LPSANHNAVRVHRTLSAIVPAAFHLRGQCRVTLSLVVSLAIKNTCLISIEILASDFTHRLDMPLPNDDQFGSCLTPEIVNILCRLI